MLLCPRGTFHQYRYCYNTKCKKMVVYFNISTNATNSRVFESKKNDTHFLSKAPESEGWQPSRVVVYVTCSKYKQTIQQQFA